MLMLPQVLGFVLRRREVGERRFASHHALRTRPTTPRRSPRDAVGAPGTAPSQAGILGAPPYLLAPCCLCYSQPLLTGWLLPFYPSSPLPSLIALLTPFSLHPFTSLIQAQRTLKLKEPHASQTKPRESRAPGSQALC